MTCAYSLAMKESAMELTWMQAENRTGITRMGWAMGDGFGWVFAAWRFWRMGMQRHLLCAEERTWLRLYKDHRGRLSRKLWEFNGYVRGRVGSAGTISRSSIFFFSHFILPPFRRVTISFMPRFSPETDPSISHSKASVFSYPANEPLRRSDRRSEHASIQAAGPRMLVSKMADFLPVWSFLIW